VKCTLLGFIDANCGSLKRARKQEREFSCPCRLQRLAKLALEQKRCHCQRHLFIYHFFPSIQYIEALAVVGMHGQFNLSSLAKQVHFIRQLSSSSWRSCWHTTPRSPRSGDSIFIRKNEDEMREFFSSKEKSEWRKRQGFVISADFFGRQTLITSCPRSKMFLRAEGGGKNRNCDDYPRGRRCNGRRSKRRNGPRKFRPGPIKTA